MRAIFQVRGLFQVGSALVLHLLCQPGWDAAAYWVPGVHLVQSGGGGFASALVPFQLVR